MRLLPLLLLLTACAAPIGRTSDRIVGDLVVAGTEQVLAGARLTLTPVEPVSAAADEAGEGLGAVALTTEAGAFLITELTAPQQVFPLLRGWAYELRADASGFYSGFVRVEFTGGELVQRLELELIDDEPMQGEQINELPADAVDNPKGTLIDEVLRRQGRRAPGR